MAKAKTTPKKRIGPDPKALFLEALGGGHEYHLKDVARALYRAKREHKENLLDYLRHGDLVASVYWPDQDSLVDLPPQLWGHVSIDEFNVRKLISGTWKASDFFLNGSFLRKHLGPRIVRSILGAEAPDQPPTTPSVSEGVHGKTISIAEKQVLAVIGMVETSGRRAEVIVTKENAAAFADACLQRPTKVDGRGRRKTKDFEDLLLEMLCNLHMTPVGELPMQDRFAEDMTKWWNARGGTEHRSFHWAKGYAKKLWSGLKKREKQSPE